MKYSVRVAYETQLNTCFAKHDTCITKNQRRNVSEIFLICMTASLMILAQCMGQRSRKTFKEDSL